MKILFWNLKKNDLSNYIKDCLIENDIDIAIFCEKDNVDFYKLADEVNYEYIETIGGCRKIAFICKKSITVEIRAESTRYAIYQIDLDSKKYIIAGLHLEDRRNYKKYRRMETARNIIHDISDIEIETNCKNTILIGDFNANPWDEELLLTTSFNSVLFKEIIDKDETVENDKTVYNRLYNPIINFLNEKDKTYGSFYYADDSPSTIWHCLDQILLSKNLINDIIDIKYLKIINGTSLIAQIRPRNTISDHLPLLAKLK